MTSFTKTGVRLVLALSVATHPVRAIAASNPLSFTAHSLNLNPIDTVRLLALDGEGAAYQVATVIDSSGRAWLRVTKTSPQGAVVASFQFGGSGRDVPVAMKVDAQGEVVVAGWTSSTDFPITTSLVTDIQTGAAFVVKLDSGLAGIIASTLIGGGTTAGALDVDSAGNIYLAGSTSAMDFPVTPGAYQTTPPGHDVFGAASFGFLAEISPGLNKIIFATYYGSNNVNCMGSDCLGAWGQTSFTALAVDPSGAIVASAYVYLSAVTPTFGSTTVKFAPGGGSVLWNTPISPSAGGGSQYIDALALDGSGAVVVAGTAYWGSAATAGALQSCDGVNPSGGFIAKLSGLSGAIQFLTYFGCESTPWAFSVNGVAIGAADAILTAGMADPSALPVTPASASGPSYLAVVAPDGSSVEQLYTAPAGIFDRAVALASGGTPVVLGSGGLLMLASSSGGPSLVGVANSAASTASGLIAPAELVSFYGSDLGPATPLNAQVVEGIVQSTFGGYELLIGDTPAPLLYMGANQINAAVPSEVSGHDSVSVTLVTPAGSFPLADLSIRPSEPEVFQDPVTGYAAAINQDGQVNSALHPAHTGELVSIWGTGAGAPSAGGYPIDGTITGSSGFLNSPALPVSVIAGNDSLEVVYAGDSPDQVFGLLQVNFRLPPTLAAGNPAINSLPVNLEVGAAISVPVWLYVAP